MKAHFQEMACDVRTLKEKLIKAIRELPQNPRITPLGPHCFSIKASDFGTKCWSAEYHDFSAQYDAVAQLVKQACLEDVIPRLEAALDKGAVPGRDQGRTRLHPEVIQHIRSIL